MFKSKKNVVSSIIFSSIWGFKFGVSEIKKPIAMGRSLDPLLMIAVMVYGTVVQHIYL